MAPPRSEPGSEHEVLISLTVTPATTQHNVPITLQLQLQNVNALLVAVVGGLQAAAQHGIRMLGEGVVARFIVGVEAGKKRGKYHLQGAIVVRTLEHNTMLIVYSIKVLVDNAVKSTGVLGRVVKIVKPGKIADEQFLVGYTQKDGGLEHYRRATTGYSQGELDAATRVYRTQGGSTTFSSDKINVFPEKDRRAVEINLGNLLQVTRWFAVKEGLQVLMPVASVAVLAAWMLQTNNYHLSMAILTGVRGAPLDEPRVEALKRLNNDASAREDVRNIRVVLYGSPMRSGTSSVTIKGLPTEMECDRMTLAQAKRFCRNLDVVPTRGTAPVDAFCGGAIVVDLLSSSQAESAATLLETCGFDVTRRFATCQVPNACGHIAEMTAVMLRYAGDNFARLSLHDVMHVNSPAFVDAQQVKLGMPTSADTVLLSDAQIVQLLSIDNPDTPDGISSPPAWMAAPGPFNAFEAALSDTLASGDDDVHIMIVNSIVAHDLSDVWQGNHWFVVAYQMGSVVSSCVDIDEDEMDEDDPQDVGVARA